MTKTVEFFYDFASPYTYLASTQIEEICKHHGAKLQWRPFLLGAVFKASGNVPPSQVAPKAQYMLRDLHDWAEYFEVPFKFPSTFPPNSLKSMRAALVAEREGRLVPFSHACFKAFWVEDRNISESDVIAAIGEQVGIPREKLLAGVEEPEIKDKLKANTEEAVARGAFGAPAFFMGDRLFWGQDRLVLLEEALK
ncbi:MAG: 2-hydroxychromene-2-carboxylate isomerase [Deltaproteobacteria bacterium]|nr:2-hydroxychromene-2-carboxylate isomerase [Deltaproteobacteria bacterium]